MPQPFDFSKLRLGFSSAPLGPEGEGERRGSPLPSGLPHPLLRRGKAPDPLSWVLFKYSYDPGLAGAYPVLPARFAAGNATD